MDFYVYVWTNVANGHRYIGKGRVRRAKQHFSNARGKRANDCPAFYAAIRKYGDDWFELDYVTTGLSGAMACAVERTFIAMYGTRAEYNCTEGGDGTFGYRHTEKARKAISLGHKGKIITEETRAKMARARAGMKHSPERVAKMRASLSGQTRSTEQKQKISEGNRRPSSKRPGKIVLTDAHRTNMCILRQLGARFRDLDDWFECSRGCTFRLIASHQARFSK